MIPVSKPIITDDERQAVLAVLDSGMLVQGSRVAELEREWARVCGVKHAIATSNGTTALHVAMLANGIGAGDEVITTPFTFIASVNSIIYSGAKPVFVDIQPGCFNINVAAIERAITPRTKAVLPVHLYGHPVNMDALIAVAQKHNLLIIEDCAQSIGADYKGKSTGSFGVGCFSLYATKNVHSVEGGMITTDDDEIARKARMLRAHGMERRYFHDVLGFNFRMSDLHAAIGLAQLRKLDEFTAKRRANAEFLSAYIDNRKVITPKARPGYGHVWHQYTIRVVDPDHGAAFSCDCDAIDECLAAGHVQVAHQDGHIRDAALEKLAAAGVGAGVFYPVPAHKQRHIVEMGFGEDAPLPVAEALAQQVLSLPVHPALSRSELEHIVEAVNAL